MAAGSELKRIREASNMTAEKFAELIGIKATRLRKWEEKDFDPREEDAEKIEMFFKVSLSELSKIKKVPVVYKVPNILEDNGTVEYGNKDHIIKLMEETIKAQQKTISSLERELDMVKETIQSNFQKVLDSQEDISALVKGGHVYLAHHYSGGKKEKFLEELTKINNACAGDLQKV